MSGSSGKGHAYILFGYSQALRIYDSVSTSLSQIEADHCVACKFARREYDEILFELVEFFNTVEIASAYVNARKAAKEAHDEHQAKYASPVVRIAPAAQDGEG